MACRVIAVLCASAQIELLPHINLLIFHALDHRFGQPVGFIDELSRRSTAGPIRMRRQAQVVPFFKRADPASLAWFEAPAAATTATRKI